jgi:HEAT repeat protein
VTSTSVDPEHRLQEILAARNSRDGDFLIRSLRDPDNRHLAALFLGELGRSDATPEITRLLDAANPLARANAARALGLLKAYDAVGRLTEIARDDPVPFVRGWATGALGRIGADASIPILLELLNDPEWRVRVQSAWALGLVGNDGAIEALKRARRRENPLHPLRRRAYRLALRSIKERHRVS